MIGDKVLDKGDIAKIARALIRLFYEGDQIQKSKYYAGDMVCVSPDITGRYESRISSPSCRVCMDRQDAVFLMGDCLVTYRTGNGGKKGAVCQYSMLLQKREKRVCLTALHISERTGREFCLTDVMEHTYYMREADILYLESGHNRTYWHIGHKVIEVTGCLAHVEKELPDRFVRIHKSFIVNVIHVERIVRCSLELSNGEILQIPVKKYTEVRNRITEAKRLYDKEV